MPKRQRAGLPVWPYLDTGSRRAVGVARPRVAAPANCGIRASYGPQQYGGSCKSTRVPMPLMFAAAESTALTRLGTHAAINRVGGKAIHDNDCRSAICVSNGTPRGARSPRRPGHGVTPYPSEQAARPLQGWCAFMSLGPITRTLGCNEVVYRFTELQVVSKF